MRSALDSRLQEITHGTLSALHSCWSNYQVLAGISEVSKSYPATIEAHDDFFHQIWRTLFDQVFTAVAALLEDSKTSNSIPRAFLTIRHLKDAELVARLPDLQSSLDAQADVLGRIVRWRHLLIAHHTEEGNSLDFQLPNRITLAQLEAGLEALTVVVQALATHVLGAPSHIRSASLRYKTSVLSIATAIASQSKERESSPPAAG
jgi:hypothetical protein